MEQGASASWILGMERSNKKLNQQISHKEMLLLLLLLLLSLQLLLYSLSPHGQIEKHQTTHQNVKHVHRHMNI